MKARSPIWYNDSFSSPERPTRVAEMVFSKYVSSKRLQTSHFDAVNFIRWEQINRGLDTVDHQLLGGSSIFHCN